MRVNTLTTEIGRQYSDSDGERLPVRTAAIAVVALSLLGWAPIVLPVLVYFRWL
jgi:hypothetical protein